MKTTVLAILIVACLAGIKHIDAARGLRVRFGLSPFNINVFYRIPLTQEEAEKDGWVMIDTPDSPTVLEEFITYCYKEDTTVCVFFEPNTLQICGLQIALCKDRFTPCDNIDMEKQGFNIWKPRINGIERECHTVQQLFVNAEYLKLSGKERMETYNTSKIIQGDTFSVTGMDKDIMEFPMDVNELEKNTLFLKKAYIPWMGTHYYYNMKNTTGCSSEEMKPWFLLTRDTEVVGCSMMTFGKMHIPMGQRTWNENPGPGVVKKIVPNAPQCFYDMVKECGAVTSHVYWIEDPQSL